MKLLGLDYGTKHLGLALTNSTGTVVLPRAPLHGAPASFITALTTLCAAESITAIVIGLPLSMNGQHGTAATTVQTWGTKLAAATGLPVHYIDERLTSKQAEAAFFEQRTRGSRQTRASKKDSVGRTDSTAAALILQTYLAQTQSTPNQSA